MKTLKLLPVVVAALIGGGAQAEPICIAVPDDLVLPALTVTRAEVLADYHMWRLAGLQNLEHGERGPSRESVEYRTAFAKYQSLRASPQFAALVAELSRRPNATVLAARSGTGSLTAATAGSSR